MSSSELWAKTKPIQELLPIITGSKIVIIADIETSGLSPRCGAEIIEIGAVTLDVESGKLLEIDGQKRIFKEFLHLTKTPRLPAKITALTTITTADLATADQPEDVLSRFYDFLGDYPVVFHNAAFDWERFLSVYFEQIGKRPTNNIICSLKLSRFLNPTFKKHGLAELCNYYGHPIEGHHRAWVDSKYTGSVYIQLRRALIARLAEQVSEQTLFGSMPIAIPSISIASRAEIAILKVNYWEKGAHHRIYVTTNVAKSYYDLDRMAWVITELRTAKDLDTGIYEEAVLGATGLSLQRFIQKYSPAA